MRTRTRLTTALVAVGALALGAGGAVATSTSLDGHLEAARHDGDRTRAVRAAIDGSKARNVILVIGDGMGDSEITVARNYARGAAGAFPGIDALPLTGQMTTYSLNRTTGLPDYVPDSASTASGWATGTKTYDNALAIDLEGTPQATLLELAKRKGLRTGNVTTSEIQDATPAAQVAHISHRSCYAPSSTSARCPEAALENGGLGSITEQIIDARADVTLGGGAASFEEKATAGRWKGRTLLDQAQARGYRVVTDAEQLARVRAADANRPVLGLFAPGNLPVRWEGPLATRTGGAEAAITCTDNPARTSAQPSLAQMTSKAIELLDDRRASKGFFLQVEGASIDKQDHAANPCGQIGETVDLDEAVQVALKFAKKKGDTLVIVTADHAHSSQIVEAGSTTPGLTRTLVTADGSTMTVAYGTSEAGRSQQHTGAQVRVAAYGPRAANLTGLIDQTDIFATVSDALSLGAKKKPGHGRR